MALLHQVLKYDRNFSTSNSALYGIISWTKFTCYGVRMSSEAMSSSKIWPWRSCGLVTQYKKFVLRNVNFRHIIKFH